MKYYYAALAIAALSIWPATGRAASAHVAACSLLTPAQVGTVLGIPMAAGQPLMPGDTDSCTWSQQGRPAPSEKRAFLSFQPASLHAAGKKPLAGTGIVITAAVGIGEDAYFDATPYGATNLHVKQGAAAFTVTVYGFSDEQIKAKEKALAKDILGKL